MESPRVVVIDDASETSAVLKAVFEPRGTSVSSIRSSSELRQETTLNPSDVLVIHQRRRISQSNWAHLKRVPQVVIGSSNPKNKCCECLPDLFQYSDLISAVERLLDTDHVTKPENAS